MTKENVGMNSSEGNKNVSEILENSQFCIPGASNPRQGVAQCRESKLVLRRSLDAVHFRTPSEGGPGGRDESSLPESNESSQLASFSDHAGPYVQRLLS